MFPFPRLILGIPDGAAHFRAGLSDRTFHVIHLLSERLDECGILHIGERKYPHAE